MNEISQTSGIRNQGTGKKKGGKGCLVGCLVTLAVLIVLFVAAVLFVRAKGGDILRWGSDRISGGGVEVVMPEGYTRAPVSLPTMGTGARASTFTGTRGIQESRDLFTRNLLGDGWIPVETTEEMEQAFSLFIEDEDEGAGMSMSFFRKDEDVLLLYVIGSREGAAVMLIAAPEDGPVFKDAFRERVQE